MIDFISDLREFKTKPRKCREDERGGRRASHRWDSISRNAFWRSGIMRQGSLQCL